jgi:antitoxin component of MazEF toxin-antitoxin module
MMTLTSKTRAQGGSVVATLPAEVARHLSVTPGQVLHWREAAPGSYLVSAIDPGQLAALEAMEGSIGVYREIFAALSK